MKQEIIDYLNNQTIAVLAVKTPEGSIHGATVHFAFTEEPFSILVGTHEGSLKGRAIKSDSSIKASIVIGFSEDEMMTFQADGEIRAVEGGESTAFDGVYLGRFPNKETRAADPGFLRAVFVPHWWRFSDIKNKNILSSE